MHTSCRGSSVHTTRPTHSACFFAPHPLQRGSRHRAASVNSICTSHCQTLIAALTTCHFKHHPTPPHASLPLPPPGHFWYHYLDLFASRLLNVGSPSFLAAKVAADTLIMGPLYVVAFYAWGCALIDGSGFEGFKHKITKVGIHTCLNLFQRMPRCCWQWVACVGQGTLVGCDTLSAARRGGGRARQGRHCAVPVRLLLCSRCCSDSGESSLT